MHCNIIFMTVKHIFTNTNSYYCPDKIITVDDFHSPINLLHFLNAKYIYFLKFWGEIWPQLGIYTGIDLWRQYRSQKWHQCPLRLQTQAYTDNAPALFGKSASGYQWCPPEERERRYEIYLWTVCKYKQLNDSSSMETWK